MPMARLADDPEDDDGDRPLLDDEEDDLGAGLGSELDDDGEPLLIDDVEPAGLGGAAGRATESEDEDEDDDFEADNADSLADLLRMSGEGEANDLQEEWVRRDMNESMTREANKVEKRLRRVQAQAEYEEERGIGLLLNDPVCRAIVVCVTTGSEADVERVKTLEAVLKEKLGDTIELAHNPDPEPEANFPLFEVWIEGYRMKVLHSRYWGEEGNLTDEKIRDIVDIVTYEVSDDAADVVGTYVPVTLE